MNNAIQTQYATGLTRRNIEQDGMIAGIPTVGKIG